MIVLPAIDLKDGVCVRLYQGEFSTAHQVAEDPVAVAKAFQDAGATHIHMVDLDGAKDGIRQNDVIVRAVIEATGLKVELGGGMRSMADLDAADQMGVWRMVIGSAAVSNPAFVREAVGKYGDRIAVGIDAKDGLVRTAGWTENAGVNYLEFAKSMEKIGVKGIIFTDIANDGMQRGPSFESLLALRKAVSCGIVASGGVTTVEDIKRLKADGMGGAIIGKAYYAGTIDLAEAVSVCAQP
ncbi:MAG: 1-(5-phosphoribosyl)-5-[(5-phosphoribosylamino)methylideneamino]imidazole-4-carboxamide isomerase [Oscillospiraceae bacterium]|jgi:phosphoribosylformimino-5-aminoimidazole carboxamide ribotide isomerase|nr:1-(5-phosphoribosyl)-5-[(5-phosphoribosylamino)methylideneamino]imidazole-4-carboxamide isomerase [Oscillospiraceae bacterium]